MPFKIKKNKILRYQNISRKSANYNRTKELLLLNIIDSIKVGM